MPLLDQTGWIDDNWPWIGEDAPLPASGRALVALSRLDEAMASRLEIGVHLPNDTDPGILVRHLGRLALISVAFPAFSDGRGFSIGRRLRGLGFRGRLRATGPVIADQFAHLRQCGFDEVALPDDLAARQPIEHWQAQGTAITLGYQRGLGRRVSILDRRKADA